MFEVGFDKSENTKASTLILEGIELDPDEEKYFFNCINKLHNFFPFDSLVELTFHSDLTDQLIYGKLSISTFEKKFTSEHTDYELNQLYDKLQLEIEKLARDWYKDWPMNKFGEVYYSMMKNETTWRM